MSLVQPVSMSAVHGRKQPFSISLNQNDLQHIENAKTLLHTKSRSQTVSRLISLATSMLKASDKLHKSQPLTD
ncbi:MAG TPA: hypothetical protein PKB02_02605 [Anaerohalosphaeraceae bacterium]|jgi:hypothetical protein|nr:hypothetical protein [Anaerohalosphaeraceae bacterium]